MAYSIKSINDNIFYNNIQTVNPNQNDVVYFTDFVQGNSISNAGSGSDGTPFSLVQGGSTISRTSANTSLYGATASSGVLSCVVGVGDAVAYFKIATQANILPGLTGASSGNPIKNECEICFMMKQIWNNPLDDPEFNYGEHAFGFATDSINYNSRPDGVYFEFRRDSLVSDTNWMIVFSNNSSKERIDTNVPVSIDEIYQLYLCVEISETGVYKTSYKITKNGIKYEGIATPSSTSFYPSSYSNYMSVQFKAGRSGGEFYNENNQTLIDYIGCKIKIPMNREILLFK